MHNSKIETYTQQSGMERQRRNLVIVKVSGWIYVENKQERSIKYDEKENSE